jgi:hypothetical protein
MLRSAAAAAAAAVTTLCARMFTIHHATLARVAARAHTAAS